MFGGDVIPIKIEADNYLVGVFIDKFGKDIVISQDNDKFQTTVKVAISNAFISWIFQFGDHVRVIEPLDVIKKIKAHIKELSKIY